MSRRCRFAWAVVGLSVPVTVSGQSRWERQVRLHLGQAASTLTAGGYSAVSAGTWGSLNNAEMRSDTVTLAAGVEYVLVGACDDDCGGLELGLFAANGYEVDAARRARNAPILRVTPRETQRYRVTVRMTGCGMNPCSYGVRLFARK